MRLFTAVSPPDDLRHVLDAVVGTREEQLRWVPVHQWHVTLAFYGEVPAEVVADLSRRLERAAAKSGPLTLRLAGVSTFPRQQSRARVLHVGVAGDVAPLTRLAERCASAARRCGLAMEDRKFRPHLTLGRARRGECDARDVVARLSSYESQPWPVNSFRLVHSTVGSSVHHETLQEFALGA